MTAPLFDPVALPPLRGFNGFGWFLNIGLGLTPVPGLIETQAETTTKERLTTMRMARQGFVPNDERLARFVEAMGRMAERTNLGLPERSLAWLVGVVLFLLVPAVIQVAVGCPPEVLAASLVLAVPVGLVARWIQGASVRRVRRFNEQMMLAGHAAAEQVGVRGGGALAVTVPRSMERRAVVAAALLIGLGVAVGMAILSGDPAWAALGGLFGVGGSLLFRWHFLAARRRAERALSR